MKNKILILSSLLCLYGIPTQASECVGADCDSTPTVGAPTVLDGTPNEYVSETVVTETCDTCDVPMQQVKLLSVKPVPADTRAPLWDGTHGEYKMRGYDKTVDWRDGVPIWDDSIVNYKYKDFSDWFLYPMHELYLENVDVAVPTEETEITTVETVSTVTEPTMMEMYAQNMSDIADTAARVEELLAPKRPSNNLWLGGVSDDVDNVEVLDAMPEIYAMPAPRPEYTAQDLTDVVYKAFGKDADTIVDNYEDCPFDTEQECEIWRKKPVVRENVSPRSPKIRSSSMNEFIAATRYNINLTANDSVAAPLLDRYKMLMGSANACCADGLAYSLRNAGASDALIYKFMADDANFYGLGARCLMMTDQDLDEKYPNTATAVVAADVRNGCLCRGRQWFQAMLAPFQDAYNANPDFAARPFYYTYTDGLQRQVTVSVNQDVQNVLNQLSVCP